MGARARIVAGRITAPSPSSSQPARALAVLLGLAAGVVVITGMRSAAFLIGPVFLALVLTVAIHPLRLWLDSRIPAWVSSVLCLCVLLLGLIGLALSMFVAAARFASLVSDYQGDFDDRVQQLTSHLEDAGVSADQIGAVADGLDLSRMTAVVTGAVSGVADFASGVVFIVTLLLFMTVDSAHFPDQLAVVGRGRPSLVEALVGFARATRRYLVVSTLFGLVVAVLDTAALALMGLPAPVLWGLLAFLTNYIPNIGFVIGLIPPAVLALLEGGPDLMLAVIAVYSLLNVVIQSVIQPKVVGDAVGLSATLTFLSLVLWTWVLGPLGAVLAVPLTLMVRAVLVEADPASRWVLPLVANQRPTTPTPPGGAR